jgi:hypothetical protein
MRKHGLTNGKGAEVKAGAGTGPGKDTVACEPVNPAVYSVDRVKAATRAKTAAAITKVAA